ncbi:MAG: hypothetical protein CMF12_01375 [Idiomarina sp.]|uniref:Uncharacterized protein n=1 Tax=Idiomarina aquatica TaxID=1327752 RepID=A0A4R6PJW8_9GAMM|nr:MULTISPECIES: hypothetical protein [Idiomarina]MAK71368.1 hypothetical protein [Idiomarinaceae bacterium]MBL4742331.1 hypothetical protein [Idiomarina sp.]MBT41151.1 hypothetical protein [Idiomarina sp.]PHQ77035.1 MAG: hypothetical protein COB75_05380 [Idiomarina sp.]TDP38225.1 hypothetical protein DEU29_10577 [Idiomarina aquatica]
MNLSKRIVILAGAVGLFFYTATQDQLVASIADYQLGWYKLGVPIAWGLVLGGIFALLKLRKLESWLGPVTLVAQGVTTMGLTGSAAIFAKHQLLVLMLPSLQIATIGIGLYIFCVSFTRLLGDVEARQKTE